MNRDESATYGCVERLHYLIDGETVCGNRVDPEDTYDTPEAGARMWANFPGMRCGKCEQFLAAREEEATVNVA